MHIRRNPDSPPCDKVYNMSSLFEVQSPTPGWPVYSYLGMHFDIDIDTDNICMMDILQYLKQVIITRTSE